MSAEDTTIDSLIRAAARAPSVAGARPVRLVKPGDLIGGTFRIEAELGRGGMGVVYRATDLTLDRQVALKIMLAERWSVEARPHLLEVFDREAKATAKLNHPSIVNLYHTGDDHGLLYLVLELLRGENLQTRIERAMPAPAEAVEIVEQILRGLVHAHEQGILHRDLKPQNVFMCDDGRVRLLDFGLASLQDRVGDKDLVAMSKGGTPNYMAPEQWLGGAQDERTDVWAVGVILYRMLSRASIAAPSSVEALRAGMAVDDLEPGLAQVIAKATSYEPSARYASARDMLTALREAIDRDHLTSPAPPRPLPHHRPRWWIASGVVATALVAAVGWSVLRTRHTRVPLRDLGGSYAGDFDRLVMQVNADGTVWGAYAHDTGFIQGVFRGDTLVGWWCEVPTRQPPTDAGEFEMRVSRTHRHELLLDGRYRYGRQGQWNETWDLTSTNEALPELPELRTRLAGSPPPCTPAPLQP